MTGLTLNLCKIVDGLHGSRWKTLGEGLGKESLSGGKDSQLFIIEQGKEY